MAGTIDMHTLITNDEMEKWVKLCDFKPLYDVIGKIEQCNIDPKVSKLEEEMQPRKHLDAKSIEEFNRKIDIDTEYQIIKGLLSFGFNHIDPIKFGELILTVFKSISFKGSLTSHSGDDGIDILLTDKREKRVFIQYKRYNDNQTIRPKYVREFLDSMTHARAEYAFFITTSTFSKHAKEFCKGKRIYLIDGENLKILFLLAILTESFGIILPHEYYEDQ